jgi:hypothetical protein
MTAKAELTNEITAKIDDLLSSKKSLNATKLITNESSSLS